MTMTEYPKAQCVLIANGQGWPDDNSRPGRGEPEMLPSNSIGYLDRPGAQQRSRVFVVGRGRIYWVNNADFESYDPTQSGIRTDPKICLSCHRLKPLNEFAVNQSNRAGQPTTRPRCKECFDRESGKALSEKAKKEFSERIGAPAKGDLWRCPCCNKYSIAGVTAQTRVDHDQERQRPRGIICDSCNTGLGRFKNGIDHLVDAADYVRRYEENIAQEDDAE